MMEFKNFHYEVSAFLHFTREETQLIFDAACTHYDFYVRQQAAGGANARVDGFIYMLYVKSQHDERLPHVLTFSQVDTMAKALEPHVAAQPALVLFLELKDVLDRINREVVRIRPTVKQ